MHETKRRGKRITVSEAFDYCARRLCTQRNARNETYLARVFDQNLPAIPMAFQVSRPFRAVRDARLFIHVAHRNLLSPRGKAVFQHNGSTNATVKRRARRMRASGHRCPRLIRRTRRGEITRFGATEMKHNSLPGPVP